MAAKAIIMAGGPLAAGGRRARQVRWRPAHAGVLGEAEDVAAGPVLKHFGRDGKLAQRTTGGRLHVVNGGGVDVADDVGKFNGGGMTHSTYSLGQSGRLPKE